MNHSIKVVAMCSALFLLLSGCETNNSSEDNSIIQCKTHCNDRGLYMDYSQSQLLGRCICDIEKTEN